MVKQDFRDKELVLNLKNGVVFLKKGDITKEQVDAIVNAANSSLMGGGGVDGAIHKAGGPAILKECKKIIATIGRCPTGNAVITTGGMLPAKYVIHTVGPIWQGGSKNEAALLRSCYIESLKLAMKNSIKTISFPSISTGAYGYPVEKAAIVAISAVKDFLNKYKGITEVTFVLFDENTYQCYKDAATKIKTI
jgi:O-acetyl-ADP-ribose deacetylase (regulator of RNase III)